MRTEQSICPSCGLVGEAPALQHHPHCRWRLSFFGAPADWTVGNIGERRSYGEVIFEYSNPTWKPLDAEADSQAPGCPESGG
ncbi:MAG: hypothetical protein U0941_25795 [Planctomycetaceae bacterium]